MCGNSGQEKVNTPVQPSTVKRPLTLPPSPLSRQAPRGLGCAHRFGKGDLSLSIQILTLFPDTASQKHRELRAPHSHRLVKLRHKIDHHMSKYREQIIFQGWGTRLKYRGGQRTCFSLTLEDTKVFSPCHGEVRGPQKSRKESLVRLDQKKASGAKAHRTSMPWLSPRQSPADCLLR